MCDLAPRLSGRPQCDYRASSCNMQPSNGNRQGIRRRRTIALLHRDVLDGSAGKCLKSERSAFRPASTSLQQTHTKATLNLQVTTRTTQLFISLPIVYQNVHTNPPHSSRSNSSRLPNTSVISERHTRSLHDSQSIHNPWLCWRTTRVSHMGSMAKDSRQKPKQTPHRRVRGDGEQRAESSCQAGEGRG